MTPPADGTGDGTITNDDAAPCAPPPTGMRLWWKAQGNANDSAGTHNGVIENGATFATGKVGQAFSFNGSFSDVRTDVSNTSDYSLNGLKPISVDLWANFNTVPRTGNANDNKLLLAHEFRYQLYWRADTEVIEFDVADACDGQFHLGFTAPLPTLAAGAWHHYAVSAVDGGASGPTFHFYFDGVEQAITAIANGGHSGCGWYAYGQDVVVGRRINLFPIWAFNGLVDEVEIFNRAITASEVAAIYDADSTGKCATSTVSVVVAPASVIEDEPANLVYTFTRDGDISAPVTVNLNVSGGAQFGTDYGQSGAASFTTTTGSVLFGAGSATATVTVDPSTDSTVEPDETVVLTLASGTGYYIGTQNSATGTILNDDGPPDLVLNKTDAVDPTTEGNLLVYTLTTTNNGGPATNVTLTDTLPANVTFAYASPGCNESGGVVTCSLGTLTFHQTATTTIAVIPTPAATLVGSVTNTATVSETESDVTPADNSDSETTTIIGPVCLAPPSGMTSWYPADSGASDIIGAQNGTLTNGASLGAGHVGNAFSLNGTNQYVAITNRGDLASNFSMDAWIYPTSVANDAWIYSAEIPDPFNTAIGFYVVAGGKLVAATRGAGGHTQYITNAVAIVPNQWQHVVVTYKGSAGTNSGQSFKFYVNGVLFSSVKAGPYSDQSGATLAGPSYNNGNAKIGAHYSGTSGFFPGLIDEVEIFNRILTPTESASLYNAGTVGKCVVTDLSLTKGDSPDPVAEANNLTYTLTAHNGGPDNASGVTITDTLPANVSFVTASPGCVESSGTVTCDVGTLANGADAVRTITVTPTPAAAGTTLSNTASVTGAEPDLNGSNNSATQMTTVAATPEVSVAVSPAARDEDDGLALAFTFTRTVTVGTLTVNFSVGGTADSGADYGQTGATTFTPPTGTVTFAGGSATATVNVTPTTDTTFESDETVVLTVTSGTAYNVAANPNDSATGTITNDDTAATPYVSVAVSPASVLEDGSSPLVYTFTRTTSTGSLTVNFSATGTADPNDDYAESGTDTTFTPGTGTGTVAFTDGEATKDVTITPAADSTWEPDETVVLTVTTGTGYNVGTPDAATGTISNDDATIVVNSIADTDDGFCTPLGTGPGNQDCTLREAIIAANSNGDPNTIDFNIPATAVQHFYYQDDGTGSSNGQVTLANVAATTAADDTTILDIDPDYPHSWWSIRPAGAQLPTITTPVVIDGYSQPGASMNTLAVGDDAILRIELDGENAGGPNLPGLAVAGAGATPSMIAGLNINRFDGNGLSLSADGITISGNFIGTDVSGTLDLGNALDGIFMDASTPGSSNSFNEVGCEIPGERNLISGNDGHGIQISGSSATNNIVSGNYIGTDRNGTVDLGNSTIGIMVIQGSLTTIGSTNPIGRNVISGNNSGGIELHMDGNGNGGSQNLVIGNYIGTDLTGALALGNEGTGVTVSGKNNTIGGNSSDQRNVISANGLRGITIVGGTLNANVGATGNTVQGNYIGVAADGTTARGNGLAGIDIKNGSQNTIGGTGAGQANIIANNGNSAFPGTKDGISITKAGGLPPANQNSIRGNSIYNNAHLGIDLVGGTEDANGVTANDVGDGDTGANDRQNFPVITSATVGSTTVSGTLDLGNTGSGVLGGNNMTIGGNTPQLANLLSGNDSHGILFTNFNSSVVQGNYIGTKADGVSARGNAANGVHLTGGSAVFITVGGTAAGEANTIAFNGSDGVSLPDAGIGNVIRGNSIFSNGTTAAHLGIDLGVDGVTANDPLDPDLGPNKLQNFPIISTAFAGPPYRIRGTLNSAPNQTYTIDLYSNPACDTSGNGEGKTYLGSTIAATGANGDALWSFNPSVINVGQFITATATDPFGNTSEFSACFGVIPFNAGTVQFVSAPYTDSETNADHTVTITVSRTGGSDDPVDVTYQTSDGTATLAHSDYVAASGTRHWNDGETGNKTFTITVKGDTIFEGDETVNINLSGATISGANPTTLKITNDDALPTFSINDVSLAEGAGGTQTLTFTVTKSGGAAFSSSVQFNTQNGSATLANNDYQSNTGSLSFASSDTTKTISVLVNGDTTPELDETFSVVLSGATGATISDNTGVGTILNDDESVSAGQLIISEFRLSGPGANPTERASNEFTELYNATDQDLLVTTTDGSAGWAVATSSGVAVFHVPNGTTIPARGHFLGTNTSGYSLNTYPAGDGTFATGDATWTTDVPDNTALAVFRTNNAANFNTTNRLDSVGPNTETNTLYREGAGYSPLAPADLAQNLEHTFFRQICVFQAGCPTPGRSRDTNDNGADFIFANTTGTTTSAGQRLGSPGPENLTSPIKRDPAVNLVFLDASVSHARAPNRERNTTSDSANASLFGTMTIRRRVVNQTGGTVTRLRFRVIDMTTYPSGAFADLRLRSSSDQVIGSINDPNTCASTGTPTSPSCTVTVKGVTLEQPPTVSAANGGGLNTTVTLPLPGGLPDGQSINVNFLLGVQKTGQFKFYLVIEALP